LRRCLAAWTSLLMLGLTRTSADQPLRVYFGLCDASAAVWLDTRTFAVADDEDNVIRVYQRDGGGAPQYSLDLTKFLQADPKEPEADIEGAARNGDLVFWITSHGRNASGKYRSSRQRFFATRVLDRGGAFVLSPTGRPYARLLQDLTEDARLQRFNLTAAARLPPKAPGALNIEGLATTPEGHLLIGFRNPIPQGRALLVPLLNPPAVLEGASAKLGDPILLNLGGRGIRDITEWGDRYLIAAGSYDGKGASRLYLWPGPGHEPKRLARLPCDTLNPEALAISPGTQDNELLVVSDDGNVVIGDRPCKKLKDIRRKQFRAAILPVSVLQFQQSVPSGRSPSGKPLP
jgi:hypothetical protein